jgi:hypothetical protein
MSGAFSVVRSGEGGVGVAKLRIGERNASPANTAARRVQFLKNDFFENESKVLPLTVFEQFMRL